MTTDTGSSPTGSSTSGPDLTGSESSEIAAQVAAFGPAMVEHFNGAYPDAVTVVARAHSGLDEVDGATMTAVTLETFTVAIPAGDDMHEFVVPFSRPVVELADLRFRSLEAVAAARATLGISEPTSLEQEAQAIDALRTHITSVVRVEELTPRYRQITFGGGDLETYQPGGLDTFLYVLLPPPGHSELTIDATFSWSQYDKMPESERPVGAYYTLRRWRPESAEIDMIFLLHAEGAATTWAANAKPGDPAALWGPRTAYEPPADTDWLLLAADETGLPAVSVILENKPAGMPAEVFVELDGPENRLAVPESPEITVHWLYRGETEAGTTTLLADAVRSFELRPGNVYAWGGAESRSVTAIRKDLRRERGIEQPRVSMVGYWRHATSPLVESDD